MSKKWVGLFIGALLLSGCAHPDTCTVKFLNWDESYLGADIVKYGETAEYGGETPVGPNNQKFTYVFKGWDLPLTDITSDCKRIAQYEKENAKYTVTFLNYDGTKLYSTVVEYDQSASYQGDTPYKPTDQQYNYAFSGWDGSLDHIQTNTTRIAQFSKTDRLYTLTFMDWDNHLLCQQTGTWGSSLTYSGPAPTREKDEAGVYIFSGWSPELGPVYQNQNYVAQYEHKLNVYTLTYLNWDGSFLANEKVEWGHSGTLTGPYTRPSTIDHTYTFEGWDKPLGPIKQDTTFTAVYQENARKYDVKFVNFDGKVLQTSQVPYHTVATYNGVTPSRSSDDFIYTFKAWDKDPALTPIDGDTTFTATYDAKTNYAVFKFIMLADGTYSVTGFLNYSTSYQFAQLHVPDTYQGVAVTAVASNGFLSNYNLTSVVLPDSITALGDSAFSNCAKLSSIVMSPNLKTIGASCFASCRSLSEIDLPKTLTSIGYSAFGYCSALKSVAIPNGVTSLPSSVFNSCTALSKATLGDSITSIGGFCFEYCSALQSVSLPAELLSIGTSCFERCSALASIIFPAKLTSIGSRAFAYCSLLAVADLPASLTTLGSDGFLECKALKKVVIPSGVTKIPSDCFSTCVSLSEVTIGSGVTSIEMNAFNYNSSLKTLTFLGSSLYSIGQYAFSNCSLLEKVILPESVASIASYAFSNDEGLQIVYIPSSVTSMGSFVFSSNYACKIYCKLAAIPTYGWYSEWDSNCDNAYFYSGSQPIATGKYWHYVNNEMTAW